MDLSSASFVPSEIALNIPFIQHPDVSYQIHIGSTFQGLCTARGNAALLCAEDSVQLLREGSVHVSAVLPSFLDKTPPRAMPKKVTVQKPIARFNLSVEKASCFFSPHPGFSGVNWFADCPPISWLRELSACSESLLEFPRTAEAFSGSAGRLPCLSGEGQTSFRVPRNRPAKSSDVLGFF